jgi:serine/threonine-protein kinase
VGLAFQVLGSFGIALSEYQGVIAPMKYVGMEHIADAGRFGLSWVSAWVLMFTVVVPSPPRRALLTAALSVCSVPIAFALYSALGINTVRLGPMAFFFALVFPYILIVGMAWVSARVVYHLGTEVSRARELGSYRLVERLGEGGMGEVWRGKHRLLARPAAVKLIRPEVLGAVDGEHRRVTLKRFEREAQATAALCSPHTVDLYDFGVSDDGAFYAVIELLDGFDLDTLVRKFGPLPAERVVHLLRQVCDSLAEAHETGLIHRDIKPANIFVCRFGRATDWIKVLDFGMVKLPDDGGDAMLTGENVAGGTPAFMAPEQALSGIVDGRSDLYSLGCVAYWLLTGEPVFSGHTPIDTIVQHVKSAPAPPSGLSEIPVPPALDSIILSCLAKSPGDRPQTADALARLLESVPLDREWGSERSRAWWDLHLPPEAAKSVRGEHDVLV